MHPKRARNLSYCVSFPTTAVHFGGRGPQINKRDWRQNPSWLYEMRMLKLRLRCTGKTPYDSNQQLSLQATINPSALLIKLYATSEVPERPTPAEKYGTGRLDRPREAEVPLTPSAALSPGYPCCSKTSKFSRGQEQRETPDRTLNTRRVSAPYHLPPPPV